MKRNYYEADDGSTGLSKCLPFSCSLINIIPPKFKDTPSSKIRFVYSNDSPIEIQNIPLPAKTIDYTSAITTDQEVILGSKSDGLIFFHIGNNALIEKIEVKDSNYYYANIDSQGLFCGLIVQSSENKAWNLKIYQNKKLNN